MGVAAVHTSREIVEQLGRTGIDDVTDHLWAQDCQSCGSPLGDQPPSLVVDDLIVTTGASLHHQECREPGWNGSGSLITTTGAMLTHVVRTLLLPLRVDGELALRPALLVNPGLEQVPIHRVDGRWRVATVEFYSSYGLRAPDPDLDLTRTVEEITGRITDSRIEVLTPHGTWAAPITASVADRVRELDGVLLVVSTMLHPGQMSDVAALGVAITAEQTTMGWIRVDTDGSDGSTEGQGRGSRSWSSRAG